MFYDTSHNSHATVFETLRAAFRQTALKMWAYMRALGRSSRPRPDVIKRKSLFFFALYSSLTAVVLCFFPVSDLSPCVGSALWGRDKYPILLTIVYVSHVPLFITTPFLLPANSSCVSTCLGNDNSECLSLSPSPPQSSAPVKAGHALALAATHHHHSATTSRSLSLLPHAPLLAWQHHQRSLSAEEARKAPCSCQSLLRQKFRSWRSLAAHSHLADGRCNHIRQTAPLLAWDKKD